MFEKGEETPPNTKNESKEKPAKRTFAEVVLLFYDLSTTQSSTLSITVRN